MLAGLLGMRATACSDKLLSTAVHLYACARVLSKGRTANASSKHEIPKSQIRLETLMMVKEHLGRLYPVSRIISTPPSRHELCRTSGKTQNLGLDFAFAVPGLVPGFRFDGFWGRWLPRNEFGHVRVGCVRTAIGRVFLFVAEGSCCGCGGAAV